MRRTPAFLLLLAVAAFWTGCASDKSNTSNAPGTTTYSNTTAAPSATSGSQGGSRPVGAPPPGSNANRPGDPGIKPPTDK